MKIKKFMALISAAVLTLSVASCGNKDDNSSASSKKASASSEKSDNAKEYTQKVDGKGATLVVYTNRSDRVDDGSYKKKTEAFEKANNCKVEYKTVSDGDYEKAMMTKFSQNENFDVLAVPGKIGKADMDKYLVSLGTYDELSKTYKWVDKEMSDNNEVYGLATGASVTGLAYNKKVWEKAGYTEKLDSMPKTPEDFVKALKQIKSKNSDCVPLITDYSVDWVRGKWNDWVLSASGDPSYNTNILKNKTDIFAQDGYYYKVYKLMFDIFSDKDLIEEDPLAEKKTKEQKDKIWDESKKMVAEGKAGCMVMPSWIIPQLEEVSKGGNDDVGFIPVPFTAKDGKQYSQTSPDYCWGINKKSAHTDLAKAYIKWYIDYSGIPEDEGMISTAVGKALPDFLSNWSDNVVFFDETSANGEYNGAFSKIDEASIKISENEAENFKVKMASAAFSGQGEDAFNKICEEANKSWSAARDSILK